MESTNQSPEMRQPSQDSEWQTSESQKKDFMSNDPEAKDFNPPEPVPCEYCGKPRHTKGRKIGDDIHWYTSGPEPCDCPEALAQLEREKAARAEMEKIQKCMHVANLRSQSGMSARFNRRTFATFQPTEENQKALRVCKAYADTFRDKLPENNPEPGRNGLFITGPMGTGKTHLVAAIANQLLEDGTAVVCMTMIDLLDRIKRAFDKSHNFGESESHILRAYTEAPLLIIDDMGKEPATEWAVSKIYKIINARYEAYMPTIITTNYTDSELERKLTPKDSGDPTTAAATIDRLREMCTAIVTKGDSWRSR